MRNLTVKERAIVIGVLVTLLLGAGHKYYRARAAAAATAVPTEGDYDG